jgi:hypothetical protein
MRTIAIILGDNDFGSTFRNLLVTIKRVLEWHSVTSEPVWFPEVGRQLETIDEQNIEFMIRFLALPHYVAFQYSFNPKDYGGDKDKTSEDHLTSIGEYFSKLRVLFDEEAELDIASEVHDSGAWYLELQSGSIMSY